MTQSKESYRCPNCDTPVDDMNTAWRGLDGTDFCSPQCLREFRDAQ